MQTKYVTTTEGTALAVGILTPKGTPHGVIQMIHGFGEHIGRYEELGARFAAAGYAFVIHDQRGHGQTAGKRGVAKSYQLFLDDVDVVRTYIGTAFDLPVILYGHSMGGNIVLNYLLQRSQRRHVCAVVGCPWLRLAKPFPSAVVSLATVMGSVSATLTIQNKVDITKLTHDTALVDAARHDRLYHNQLSFRLFSQITKEGEYALAHAAKLTLPTLLLCAGQDALVSPDAIRQFAQQAGPAVQLQTYDDLYHELHNEVNRAEIFDFVQTFVANHCTPLIQ